MANDNKKRTIEMKKDTVLKAAIRLFAEKNYEATTMAEIAREANVSFGSVSIYFGNKEELFMACVVLPLEEFTKSLLDFDPSPNSYREEIQTFILKHFELFSTQKEYLRLLVQVIGQYERFSEAFKVVNEHNEKLNNKVSQLIVNGQQANQLADGDAEKIAIAYVSLLFGLRLSYADDPSLENWNQFAEIAMRLFGPK
ncbi:TetR/AcrR family transcriptional regulator [Paenisporosarcina quisquiliarum]|uniref:TetR/AcrR family transcriptional regulator n=1 Tax=Paenisporosarcina quisquiliarum TaxID=365346 RepID=A0A9X3RCL1_9BACL|nr:TetR/AcrR family transcriptional regulator [Paenisporosarcina quisquiliarum]MCZ8536865.1 TetR/AcrR family transcriptional regulator [Paenisporosarcina quisquiliarum]